MRRGEPFNVLRNPNNWSASPRAEAIVGALFTGLQAGTFAYTATVALVSVGLSLVTSWAVAALTPQPKGPSRSLLVNAREPAAPQDFVYGEVRKGGTITYYESTDGNQVLHQIIALAGHEIEDIVEIYINDEVATLSNDAYSNSDGRSGAGWVTSPSKWTDGGGKHELRIFYHLGDQTSINDTFANSSTSTLNNTLGADTANDISNFVGNGIPYLYVRYSASTNVYANGLPLITARVKGKKVYDPRTTSTAYSNNAALCIRDYLTSAYGLDDDQIDDTVFAAAANVCDEDVNLDAGGTEKRYTINGVVNADQSHGRILQDMTTACAGTLFWGGGKWKLSPAAYNAPTKTLTLDDLRSPITLQTRTNLQDQFNKVQGVFNDAASRWIPVDYPPIESSTFVTEDGGTETPLNLDLPLTTSSATAQRLAKLTLFRGREQMTLTADFGMNAFDVEVGDIIALTFERYGWTAKEFEVVGWRFGANGEAGDLRVTMTLRETSSSAFSWNAEETAIISNNSNLLSYTFVPDISIPSNGIRSFVRVIREKITEVITVNVTTGNPAYVDYVDVQYKAVGDSEWTALGSGDLGNYELVDPEPGEYIFRARAINGFGYKGDWVESGAIQTAGSATPPGDVRNLFYEVNGGNTILEWDATENLDLSFYRIRHAVETSGATWANSTTAVDKVPRPGTSVVLPSRPGTYLIKAYDKTGIASQGAASVVVTSDEIVSYTNTLTQAEHSTFNGTKIGCEVDTGKLVITDTKWNVSAAAFERSFSVSAQEGVPIGLSFKTDGTKMYVLGQTGDDVNEYDLSTAWDISTASYVQNFDISSQETLPSGMFFKPDGTKMYVIGFVNDNVNEYDLSTAWDISTASYTQAFDVSSEELTPTGVFFKPDGLKMYICGNDGDEINEYDLSSAWDISTATYSQNFSVAAQDTTPQDLFFKSDGTKMYVIGSVGDDINEYTLSSAWDISTASYSQNFSVSAKETNPSGLFFTPNGDRFYIVGFDSDSVHEYSLVRTPTYEFSTYIETGDSTARIVRSRVDAAVERIDSSAGQFDDLPGLFDELPGLFDDFTGNAQFADTNLLFYIATTPDDPAGSPTWSDWKQFRAGEFYGRGFKFKVELRSTSDNVTPAISTLTALVEYN